MIPILSSAQARAFDRFVGEHCAVPSLLLMENAGRSAALLVHEWLAEQSGGSARSRRVCCVCGAGNNGGDGFVVARQLATLGHRVCVLLAGEADSLAADARVNFGAWVGLGGELVAMSATEADRAAFDPLWREADGIVDALFGTGLSRALSGRLSALVDSINASGVPVFALDVPSGLNADTGAVMGTAVRARVTITFGHPKPGLLTSGALDHTGELCVADLGVPRDLGPALSPSAFWLEQADAASWLTPRSRSTHKGRSGRVLVIAGSVGKTGAALLSSSAALRAGAGLVTICTFADAQRSLEQRVVEVMTEAIDLERLGPCLDHALDGVDSVVIGPGLGLGEAARKVVDHVVLGWDGAKVIDADAITLFSGRARELQAAPGVCLLTPHPGELARLLGQGVRELEADRFAAMARALELTGQTLLLKGPHTLIAEPGTPPWVSSEGHPALASGGSGDVLAGICGAFMVERPPLRAGALAAYVHGRAARLWVQAHAGADRGLLARELADFVPEALASLASG